jgi:serine-type D-Ala-D-Ala carboxypeptidase/endopeptidase (penicillin-binding protein 4)
MFFKFFFPFFLFSVAAGAQTIDKQLAEATTRFAADSQLKHAIFSLYVLDANTGEVVLDRNSQTGLATASCLKLVTSAMAFTNLGKNFHFKTTLGGDGVLTNGIYTGNLYISGGGDPSLGSWRWPFTKPDSVLNRMVRILKAKGIEQVNGNLYIDDYKGNFHNVTPGGWLWEDIGNYYGAAARQFNWHENQFDLSFETGLVAGTPVVIKKTSPSLPGVTLHNYVKTGARGSGDQSVIYLPPFSSTGYITGSLPAGETNFTVSGAIPNPTLSFAAELSEKLKLAGLVLNGSIQSMLDYYNQNKTVLVYTQELGAIESPSLDSLNYWFMKKSINVYGEAFIKAAAKPAPLYLGDTKEGVAAVKAFAKQLLIQPAEMNTYDGSGLSPLNRVTTRALATVLQYACKQPWFSSYYNAFPEYNGMKLKSGTVNDVKGFAGYHKAKNGREYIIAFLVNNYNGKSSGLVGKMYKVLDVLK